MSSQNETVDFEKNKQKFNQLKNKATSKTKDQCKSLVAEKPDTTVSKELSYVKVR